MNVKTRKPKTADSDEDITIAPFDPVKYLDSEQAIAAYIEAALEENDLPLLLSALSDVIRARGISSVAKEAGVGRESLYKTLSPGSNPKFETITKLLAVMGFRLSLAPKKDLRAKRSPTSKEKPPQSRVVPQKKQTASPRSTTKRATA